MQLASLLPSITGEVFPKHTHPDKELVFDLEGTLEYQVEGKPPATLKRELNQPFDGVLRVSAETLRYAHAHINH